MLKVANATWSFTDDIVFGNPALVLFAHGCKWACPGCHNKELQCFESTEMIDDPFAFIYRKIINAMELTEDVTLVGSGGDFYFQMEDWVYFCEEVKYTFPNIKIVWYTGLEYDTTKVAELEKLSIFDGILWGRLNNTNGKVVKTLSKSITDHKLPEKVIVSDYRDPNQKGETN